jgi:hypothetical protein
MVSFLFPIFTSVCNILYQFNCGHVIQVCQFKRPNGFQRNVRITFQYKHVFNLNYKPNVTSFEKRTNRTT